MNVLGSAAEKTSHSDKIAVFSGAEVAQPTGAEVAQETKATQLLRKTLPRGITVGTRRDGRGSPFYVRWWTAEKDRPVQSFEKEADRNNYARKLADGMRKEGEAVLNYDAAEWKRLQHFKAMTGVSLDEAQEIILRVKGNLRLNLTVKDAVERYVKMRSDEGVGDDGHSAKHLERFSAEVGYLPLCAIQPEHVRTWLAKLKLPPYSFAPVTRNHHRKSLYAFCERAILEKWTLENPVKVVRAATVDATDTTVLSAHEVFLLLKSNLKKPIIAKLCLELFGFLRCSSVERIQESDIRWEARGIVMHGSSTDEETEEREQGHKSGKRKFRQGQPPVLWDWLKHGTPDCWTVVTKKNYDELKLAAFDKADVENPGNVLRHTCASVALASTKNMPYVSYQMQHSSLSMTERYEGVYEEMAANMVLSMTPAAVRLSWKTFQKRWREFFQPIVTNLSLSQPGGAEKPVLAR